MNVHRLLLKVILTFLSVVISVNAGTRAVLEVEVIKGDDVEKHAEIITFDDERARIDFVGEDRKVTDETPYIMTVDGGATWVMGDKPKDKFYCTSMKTDEFFTILGERVTSAMEFFNVTAEAPKVKQTLEEPGPEIMGYKTTHVQIETNANAYVWILFFKIEYSVKIVEDLWYTTDFQIHPVRKKWIDELTQSGNSIIDEYTHNYISKLPGPVLKTEMVMDITNVRKKKTKTQKERTGYVEVREMTSAELDEVFRMPECEKMDDKEVEEKAKSLFSAGRIML